MGGVIHDGIKFFDNIPLHNLSHKQIHHFRSFTAKEEATYVKQCWFKCLESANSLIPAEKIKVDKEEKKFHYMEMSKICL